MLIQITVRCKIEIYNHYCYFCIINIKYYYLDVACQNNTYTGHNHLCKTGLAKE